MDEYDVWQKHLFIAINYKFIEIFIFRANVWNKAGLCACSWTLHRSIYYVNVEYLILSIDLLITSPRIPNTIQSNDIAHLDTHTNAQLLKQWNRRHYF